MKTKRVMLFLAFALALAGGESGAQSYPNKPIKFLVGSQAGGGTDVLARLVGQKLAEQLGQPVIVTNKPGADGIIATEWVAKSDPDGYTLLVGTDGSMVVATSLYAKQPYDPVKDFTPITLLAVSPLVFAVHPSFPPRSIDELIALAKAKPGGLFYASGAPQFYVATELFKKRAGVNMVHVPFKGSGPAINAVVSGQLPLVVTSMPSASAQLRAGGVRGLAVVGPKRYALVPDIPTMAESGLPNLELIPWTGLFAPVGTPSAIVDKLYSEVSQVLKSDSLKERFATLGYETSGTGMPPAGFGAFHKAEVAKWTKVVKDFNIRVE